MPSPSASNTQVPAGAVMDLAAARDVKLLDQIDRASTQCRSSIPGIQADHYPERQLSETG